jgi:peptidyl-prolyl cis-trans isomerase C
MADQSYEVEDLVLGSPEARGILITPDEVERAYAEVAQRYTDGGELEADLQRNGLDESLLREALRRELIFDSAMQRVAARAIVADDLDMRLFYELNEDKFRVVEKRVARHILVTINEDYAENTRAEARRRIEALRTQIDGSAKRFVKTARRHSECPTALEGGKLGTVQQGQLYPELDAVLFGMEEGGVSEVVESEIGLHLLLCEKVQPARHVPYSKARDGIHEIITRRNRRNCQKAWVAALRRGSSPQRLS